ncbi:MAG TPA: response regulator transcription factor [Polyangia bacterium]|jgi:DNA-binding response OmpR family regulator|nr:response regulator transcription factor [Polyangia bacterium]
MRVLVVEDYEPLARSLAQGLREAAYAVDVTGDGAAALELARTNAYDALVLDLMVPKLDGLSVLRRLRADGSRAGVLIITARDQVPDRVGALDLGADDYLVKPFAFEELLARLRAVIRRRYGAAENLVRVGDLELDGAARTVKRGGRAIALSAREFALLEYLALRRGQVVTRTEIWEHVYDFAAEPSSNVVDVYVGYLRRKLGDGEGGAARLIQTHRGLGYALEAPEPT